MSALTVELPEGLRQKAQEVAAAKGLPLESLAAIALSQTLSRLVHDPELEQRAARATGQGIKAFLEQVPDVEPEPCDRLNPSG